MWKSLAYIACGLLTAACLPLAAQDEPADEGSGASTRSADEVQREALRALMGDDEGSHAGSGATSGTSRPSSRTGSRSGAASSSGDTATSGSTDAGRSTSRDRSTTRDAAPGADSGSPARSSASSRGGSTRSRDEAPSSGSVPEVPAAPTTPPADATAPGDTSATPPASPSPYTTDTAPPDSFGTDNPTADPTAGLPPEQYPADNALAADNAVDQQAGGARSGSAIIIGLIILAVLLVALAAVVGFMAAHRSHPAEPMPGAPVPGWAYFTAPNAPNIGLQKTPFLIGSSQQSDLVLADPKASPEHARVDHTAEGYVLTDLNSLNGTYLNGQRIASPVVLRPGDEVRMGDIAVKFEVYS